jgi:hypothetical protein
MRSLTWLAALSISSDHFRQPVAALSHCWCCASRNSAASIVFDSMHVLPVRLRRT